MKLTDDDGLAARTGRAVQRAVEHKHVPQLSDRASTDPNHKDHISDSVDLQSACSLELSSGSVLDTSARIGTDVTPKSDYEWCFNFDATTNGTELCASCNATEHRTTSLQKVKERRSDSAQTYKAWHGSCRERPKRSHDETLEPGISSERVRNAQKTGAGSKQHRDTAVHEGGSGALASDLGLVHCPQVSIIHACVLVVARGARVLS
jgi:hypothetical protein